MSVHDINVKKAENRAKELKEFLTELDSIADKLYNRLEYKGVWDMLMELENVRVQYYVEFHEHQRIIRLRGR